MISQPDAVSNMAVPTFDRRLAVHITVNATELNAPQREGADCASAAGEVRSALKLPSSLLSAFMGRQAFEQPRTA